MKQQKIVAIDGMILTNGQVCGKEIFVGEGINIYEFYQITEEQYEKMMEEAETKSYK